MTVVCPPHVMLHVKLNIIRGLPLSQSSLPSFAHATSTPVTLQSLSTIYEQAVENILRDDVNSTAAMKVRYYLGDCIFYPLIMMLEALSRRETSLVWTFSSRPG